MNQTKPNFSAFPMTEESSPGLTKREYFAAMALQGLLAANEYVDSAIPQKAVDFADAVIAKLNETER